MREVLRSTVNTWDCDQMGHMNVRHYFGRFNEGLAALMQQSGLSRSRISEHGVIVRATDQHVRFSHELRPGAAFAIQCGSVCEHPAPTAYSEMRTLDGKVSATAVTTLGLFDPDSSAVTAWPAELLETFARERCTVPPYAAVRGVAQRPTRSTITHQQALAAGLLPGFLGSVLPQDCDPRGVMHEAGCMARISDGISHTFRELYGTQDRPSGIGGAALEYRYVFHRWLRTGDLVEVRTGLSAIASKALQFTHYLFELSSGECAAASQAVVVWFDLAARKAVAVPDELRKQLHGRVIAGLAF